MGKEELIQIETSDISTEIKVFWENPQGKKLIFLQCNVESNDESLGGIIQALLSFKKAHLERLDFEDISPNILDIKYKQFLSSLDEKKTIKQGEIIAPFSPQDIFDRRKFDSQEATILSVILTRLIEGKAETKEEEFKNYHLQFDPGPVIYSLQSRGFLAKSLKDEEIVYSIPHFYLKETMEFFEGQRSLVLIIHSFGGGVAKTTLSVNMAKVLSDHGVKCLLIDLDFISSRIGAIFSRFIQSRGKSYLDDFLDGKAEPDQLITKTVFQNLDLILTDSNRANLHLKAIGKTEASRLLERYISLFNYLRKEYDMIIIDAEGSLDFNIMNVFLLADLALILSNGNRSSLEGLKRRVSLILQRIGLGIRNDILVQTLVPPSRVEKAIAGMEEWKREFNMEGMQVYNEPIVDEQTIREQIFDDKYFTDEDAKLTSWIENFLKNNKRIHFFLRNKKNSIISR